MTVRAVRVQEAVALAPVPEHQRPNPSRSPEEVYLAKLSENGRAAMHGRLLYVARMLGAASVEEVPWERMRYQDVAAIRARLLACNLSPATMNLTLSALRGVARESWRLGFMTSEEHALVREVESVPGSRLLAGREVAQMELRTMLEVCKGDPTLAGRRDAAAILLLYGGGLRRSELPELELSHWDPSERRLRVLGKGNKEREVFVAHGTAQALEDWLEARGKRPGKLFLPINKGGSVSGTRMSDQAVYKLLNKRRTQAGLPPLSPHDLRRTWVGDLLDVGADLSAVQKLAGHASPTTTARYDRRGRRALRRAADLLDVPYGEG
ncbi:MAG: site-specific integrase [Actinomycetota bacterium]|nr:site-specific integrase [Actinomycetota bacterium]